MVFARLTLAQARLSYDWAQRCQACGQRTDHTATYINNHHVTLHQAVTGECNALDVGALLHPNCIRQMEYQLIKLQQQSTDRFYCVSHNIAHRDNKIRMIKFKAEGGISTLPSHYSDPLDLQAAIRLHALVGEALRLRLNIISKTLADNLIQTTLTPANLSKAALWASRVADPAIASEGHTL